VKTAKSYAAKADYILLTRKILVLNNVRVKLIFLI